MVMVKTVLVAAEIVTVVIVSIARHVAVRWESNQVVTIKRLPYILGLPDIQRKHNGA